MSTIIVRLDLEIQVKLPEHNDIFDQGFDGIKKECEERAVEAALSALPQSVDVFIDGEEKEPAQIYIDVSENCVEEIRGE